MISFLVFLSVLVSVAGFVLLRREIKALREAQSRIQNLNPESVAALLEKLLGDSELAKIVPTVRQIRKDVLVVASSQVILGNNDQLIVDQQDALRQDMANLAYATRVLNAAEKKRQAEEAVRATAPDRANVRELMRLKAEEQDRNQPQVSREEMGQRAGLISPGALNLPQDKLPRKGS